MILWWWCLWWFDDDADWKPRTHKPCHSQLHPVFWSPAKGWILSIWSIINNITILSELIITPWISGQCWMSGRFQFLLWDQFYHFSWVKTLENFDNFHLLETLIFFWSSAPVSLFPLTRSPLTWERWSHSRSYVPLVLDPLCDMIIVTRVVRCCINTLSHQGGSSMQQTLVYTDTVEATESEFGWNEWNVNKLASLESTTESFLRRIQSNLTFECISAAMVRIFEDRWWWWWWWWWCWWLWLRWWLWWWWYSSHSGHVVPVGAELENWQA